MLTDKDLISFGKHKGTALANVPADYLLYIYDFNNLNQDLRDYIKRNLDVLKAEVARNKPEQSR